MFLPILLLFLQPSQPVPSTPDEVAAYTEAGLSPLVARHNARTDEQRVVIVRLAEMVAVEQEGRDVLGRINDLGLDKEATQALHKAVWSVLTPIDEANQAELVEFMDRFGWFPSSVWGEDAAFDAWLIAQHGSVDLQKRVLALMEPLLETGDANRSNYALMFDRVALREGRQQRYGSQTACIDGEVAADDLEEPDTVDVRRAEMGLEPLAQYLTRFNFPCE